MVDIKYSVPLPLVIKPKVVIKVEIVKEALQWGSKLRVQVQIYVNQAEITSELHLQCNYFTRVERHFRSKNS